MARGGMHRAASLEPVPGGSEHTQVASARMNEAP